MFNFDSKLIELSDKAVAEAKSEFDNIDSITEYN